MSVMLFQFFLRVILCEKLILIVKKIFFLNPGFNPNPKTAADYRRNTQVLEEINKNHEDVLFQVPSKHVRHLLRLNQTQTMF